MDSLQFLIRSRNRLRVLCTLCESPSPKTTLQEDLEMARTTLRRHLHELEERGWIYRIGTTYHAVFAADLVVETITRTISEVDTAARLTTFFETIPASLKDEFSAVQVEEVLDHIDDVTITVPTQAAPYGLWKRLEESLSTTGSLHGFSPTDLPVTPAVQEGIARNECSGELVLHPLALERTEGKQEGWVAEPNLRERIRMQVSDLVPPYALLLLESDVLLVGFDEYYRLQVIVEFPHGCESVVEWANAEFERVRDEASPLDEWL